MVTVAGYPPASLIWRTNYVQEQADRTRDALRDLCAPMAQVATRRSLESYLATVEQTYERLGRRFLESTLNDKTELVDLFRMAEDSRDDVETLIESNRGLLGDELAEQLSAATRSFYGFAAWTRRTMERVLKGDSHAFLEAPQFTSEQNRHVAWSGLCFLAIRLILEREIQVWEPASLKILVKAFDVYMESIEDAFLGAAPPPDLSDVAPMSSLSDVLDLPA